MDEDSSALKYIEIVPRDDYSNVTDIKFEPVDVKVSVVYSFYSIYLVNVHIYVGS